MNIYFLTKLDMNKNKVTWQQYHYKKSCNLIRNLSNKTINSIIKAIYMKMYYILVIGLFLGSCSDKKESGIKTLYVDLDQKKNVNLSLIASSTNLIKLETSDSCLMSYISCLDVSDNFIFVNGGGVIYQFDMKGKFIRQVGKQGRGPNEYLFAGNLVCDNIRKRIYIAAHHKILCYDFEGKYISTINQNSLIEYLTIIEDELYEFHTMFGENSTNEIYNRVVANIYTINGHLSDSLVIKNIKTNTLTGTINPNVHYFSQNNKQVFFYYPVLLSEPIIRDTIYRFSNNIFIPHVKLKFAPNPTNESHTKKILIKNMYVSGHYLFVELNYNGIHNLFFSNTKNNEQFLMENGFVDDIHQTGKVILYPLRNKPKTMYSIINAYECADKLDDVKFW